MSNSNAEDNTVNRIVKFEKSRYDDIAFLYYCFSKDTKDMGGYAVYEIPIMEYWKALECESVPSYRIIPISEEQKNYYEKLLNFVYSIYDEEIDCRKLPNSLLYTNKISASQAISLENFLSEVHPAYIDRRVQPAKRRLQKWDPYLLAEAYKKDNQKFYEMLSAYKEKYDNIYLSIINKGIVTPRWKSEYEMYELIKRYFQDAIYQYKAKWLNKQSLDVFIPSIKVAVEYQGKQHYEPVKVFGGTEKYDDNIRRDSVKKKLCAENHIHLIEWKYTEPVNIIIFMEKFKDYLN